MNNLIKKFSFLDVRRIDKFNFTKKVMRYRVKNFGIEIDTSFKNTNYDISKNAEKLIINIFNNFKTKNVSKSVYDLFNFLNKMILKIPKKSDFICKSSDAYVNPSTVLSIQSRFKETMTKKCPWSKKEVDLLKRLMNDIGG